MQPHAQVRSTAGAFIVTHWRSTLLPGTHIGGPIDGHIWIASGTYASSIGGESMSASALLFGLSSVSCALNEQPDKAMTTNALTTRAYHRAIGGGGTT